MTRSLAFFGIVGIVVTVVAFFVNRRIFTRRGGGPVTPLEAVYYLIGVISLGLGWYFNVRYVHSYPKTSSYVDYTKMLFSNWAADSAAQDYIIVNLLLLPLWTIVDGRRRGLRAPWIFFLMSLATSLAFSMALFLAFIERQIRANALAAESSIELHAA